MKKKLLALFLCCALSFGLVTAALITPASADEDFLVYGSDGLVAHTVELAKNNKLALTAVASTGSGVYQWQIQVGGDVWANISGANGVTLDVSYALVANLLYGGAANLRCRLTAGETVKYTNTVTMQITDETPVSAPAQAPKAPTVISEAEPVGEPVIIPPQTVEETPAPDAAPAGDAAAPSDDAAPAGNAPAPSNDAAPAGYAMVPANGVLRTAAEDTGVGNGQQSLESAAPAPVNDPAPSDNGEDEDDDKVLPATYTITIRYNYENGNLAFPSWSATVPAGSTFIQTVHSPVILGYNADQDKIEINEVVNDDIVYTVIFKPSNVGFKVNHNWQNVADDSYTLHETIAHDGLTGQQVGNALEKVYDGFVALLYDSASEVAADGSTVVEIKYDRHYFLMNFDLGGGYGVEPIYARYEAPTTNIGTPQRAGYTFAGWEAPDGTVVEQPMSYMPLNGISYKAKWTAGESAKVTIVVWGENADDENYTYYKNAEIMAKPGETLTIDSLQGALICGLEEHTHSSGCIINCTHSHTTACYSTNNSLIATTKPSQNLTAQGNGIYTYETGNYWTTTHYYVNIGTEWYCGTNWRGNKDDSQRISFSCNHTHTDDCYSCGKVAHTHTSACRFNASFMDDPDLWKMVRSDEVTVAADGTTVMNVYYDRVEFTLTFRANNKTVATIPAKWGADISGEFSKAPFNTTYNGRAWKCTESSKFNYALQTLDRMPQFDATFNLYDKSSNDKKTIYYYVQKVGTTINTTQWPTSTANFDLLKQVDTYFNFATYNEEYHEIQGFTRYTRSVAGFDNSGRKDFTNNKLNLYYIRNSYTLTFFNRTEELTNKTQTVQYEAPLGGYYFVPDYPAGLEPNAYVFDGWYTTAGLYEGSEADMSKMTMPAGNVILYAKWTPKNHTVKTYLTEAVMDGNPMDTWSVPHSESVNNPPQNPTNGNYEFVGWFYKTTDADGNEVEKAFDFSMPVNRDLDLYAKWRSNTPVNYNVRYVLQDDPNTEVASPTTGSALAGSTKTFVAKTGDLLNEGYKDHYFPTIPSTSILLEIDETNEYIFYYVYRESVSYKVRYLNRETGEPLANDKIASSDKAVVTENFKRIPGYMPDAYQKQLVLSVNEEENVLIFWYVEDPFHAPVQITHWVQNADGSGYTMYQTSTDLNAPVDETYTVAPLDIPGFVYNADPTNPVDGNPPLASDVLTVDGLSLNLYYDRILYPYEFRFLEYGTNTKVEEPVSGTARYQDKVTQEAKTVPGYTLVEGTPNPQTITIAMEDGTAAVNNVRTFYYVAETVNISYRVVGPTGCGTLDPYQENGVKVMEGPVNGSTPTANAGFKFVGWFKDEACTEAADASWISADNKMTPGKTKNYGTEETTAMGYEAATYYAKFEYDVADLSITKQGYQEIDGKQSFIFTVTGPDGFSKKIVIQGNGTVVLKGLKIGEYTVTEDTAWSWRYTPKGGAVQKIELQPGITNTVNYMNDRTNDKWLDGNAYCKNVFGTIAETDSGN